MAKKKAARESWGIVEPLPSGRYRARYTHRGQRYGADRTFITKDDARGWLAGVRTDISRGVWVDPNIAATVTIFGPYSLKWVAERLTSKGRPLAPKTRSEYERQLGNGLAPFAPLAIDAITGAFVREWHAARMRDGATQAGAEARLLHAIFATAIQDGLISANPVESKMGRASSKRKFRAPTLQELDVIYNKIDERFRLAILIAAYGSARISEWRALRRRHITFAHVPTAGALVEVAIVAIEYQAQYVEKQWHERDVKSEEGEREVVLPAALTPIVKDHLHRFVGPSPDALLFPSGTHQPFLPDRAFWNEWDRARRAAGIKREVREHDLRKFAGTQHAIAGATMRETMAFLGHSTTAAAMAYQVTTGREAELANRMPLPASITIEPLRPTTTQ
ncbi:MAG: hypothetical protein K0S37_4095 [Microbacterium sp.]|jgi:integrase|nr:hypothetical protein [Microbacterium sp.]